MQRSPRSDLLRLFQNYDYPDSEHLSIYLSFSAQLCNLLAFKLKKLMENNQDSNALFNSKLDLNSGILISPRFPAKLQLHTQLSIQEMSPPPTEIETNQYQLPCVFMCDPSSVAITISSNLTSYKGCSHFV